MQFDNSFFEDEVRNGFFIPSKMKRYWASQLEILSYVEQICERHGLDYFANYGTLLGAVRHGGFIPWDDDMDICMKRKDAMEFIKYAKEELPGGAFVLTYESEGYSNLLYRVVNSNYVCFDDEFLGTYHGCPYITGIDIFVFDKMAPTAEKDKEHCEDISAAFKMAASFKTLSAQGVLEKFLPDLLQVYEGLAQKYNFVTDEKFSLVKKFHLLGERILSFYNDDEHRISDDIDSIGEEASKEKKTVMLADFGNRINFGKHTFPEHYFDKSITIPFENTKIRVSPYYNELLADSYGNYMLCKRGSAGHEYPVFSIQDKAMEENMGVKFQIPEIFNCENSRKYNCGNGVNKSETESTGGRVEESATESNNDSTNESFFYCKLNEYVQILDKINKLIPIIIFENNVDNLLGILENAQNVAQILGTKLEEALDASPIAESSDIVKYLEDYCENIYLIYQFVVGEVENISFEKILTEASKDIEAVAAGIEVFKNRVRVQLYSIHPENISPEIIEMFSKDEHNDVYIAGIPFEYKTGKLSVDRAMGVDSDISPVPSDLIVIFEGCDDRNPAIKISENYFASNLRNCCKQLIFIPNTQIAKINSKNDVAFVTLAFLLANEASIYADKIYVSEPENKKYFWECLDKISEGKYRELWEEKLSTCGLGYNR